MARNSGVILKDRKKPKLKKKLGAETEASDSIVVTFNIKGLTYSHHQSLLAGEDNHSIPYLVGWRRVVELVPKVIFPLIKEDSN